MAQLEAAVWPNGIGAITLFVEELDATKRFYQKTFGLPVVFEDNLGTFMPSLPPPNPSLDADVPHGGLRPGRGPPVGLYL